MSIMFCGGVSQQSKNVSFTTVHACVELNLEFWVELHSHALCTRIIVHSNKIPNVILCKTLFVASSLSLKVPTLVTLYRHCSLFLSTSFFFHVF